MNYIFCVEMRQSDKDFWCCSLKKLIRFINMHLTAHGSAPKKLEDEHTPIGSLRQIGF